MLMKDGRCLWATETKMRSSPVTMTWVFKLEDRPTADSRDGVARNSKNSQSVWLLDDETHSGYLLFGSDV